MGLQGQNKLADLTDEEIIRRVQRGETALYEEIVRRYQQKLIYYTVRIVGDEDTAADVVQESFISAYIKIQAFKLDKKFSSWLYRIVHNKAIDYIRKHKKEVALSDNTWILDTVPDKVDHVEELSNKMELQTLHRSLQVLPIEYRMVVQLYYFDEKSYQEIADILRIPTGTVATRLSRGKKLLGHLYGEEWR